MNTGNRPAPAFVGGPVLRLLGVFAVGAAFVSAAPILPATLGGGAAHAEVCSAQRTEDDLIVQDCYGAAPSTFAAVAVAQSNLATGSAWGFGSLAQAQSRAMAECRARGGDCQIAIWAQNGCAAVATGRNGAWGSGWDPYYDIAEARALGECRRNGGEDCTVVSHPCSAD